MPFCKFTLDVGQHGGMFVKARDAPILLESFLEKQEGEGKELNAGQIGEWKCKPSCMIHLQAQQSYATEINNLRTLSTITLRKYQ